MTAPDPVALVHDYLTQRGGAERVVLSLATAYPGAPIHTSFYDPDGTFPDFAGLDIHTLPLDRVGALRTRHRLALPLLAPAFSRLTVDAEVAICSSSGWAHGAHVTGRKVVYCHTPARWLYQASATSTAPRRRRRPWCRCSAPPLRCVGPEGRGQRPPLPGQLHGGPPAGQRPLRDRRRGGAPAGRGRPGRAGHRGRTAWLPGFFLCVSRLLPYKNVDAVAEAFRRLPAQRLVVVGSGPMAGALRAAAPPNVTVLGGVDDPSLRWLYRSCAGLVAASHEDFGLTPVEAAGFGKPTAALRWGGFLDTMVEGTTGVFFDRPEPTLIAEAVAELSGTRWSEEALRSHAERFSVARFVRRIGEVVAEERNA